MTNQQHTVVEHISETFIDVNIPTSRNTTFSTPVNPSINIDRCNVKTNKNGTRTCMGLTPQQIEVLCNDEIYNIKTGYCIIKGMYANPTNLRLRKVTYARFIHIMNVWNIHVFKANV